jgi:hypothetical protein
MTRFAFLLSGAVLLLGLAVSPATAQSRMSPDVMAPDADPTSALKDDCDVPALEDAKVDSCLERSRALQESTPSPDIELLTSKLEQRSVQRFDPNSTTPPTTQSKGGQASLDAPDNVTTPPAKMLSPDPADAVDARPTQDPVEVANGDGAKRPVQGDAKLDDGNPPDTNTDDPPPPETPSLRDDGSPH